MTLEGTRCLNSKLIIGHKNWVLCVVWSPDAQVIATGSYDNTVPYSKNMRFNYSYDCGIQRLEKRKEMRFGDIRNGLLHLHGNRYICIQDIEIAVDRRLSGREDCRLASSSKDTTIKIWDTIQRRPVFTLSGHTAAVTCLRWGGNNYIYSGSQDKSIRIWGAKDVFPSYETLISGKIIKYFICSCTLGEYDVIINGLCHSNRSS
jgi:ribosome assembly protein 4